MKGGGWNNGIKLMADLSFLEYDSATACVDRAIAEKEKTRQPRGYLGMSEIGEPCARKLWFQLNYPETREQFDGRMLRLFRTGHLIEEQIILDYSLLYNVSNTQMEFSDFGEMFKGHCDGIIQGLPESSQSHIFEAKSANDKNFKLFKKNMDTGGHPYYGAKYIAQVQCYMGYSRLKRALVVIENKNDSDRCQERIRFDGKVFDIYRKKAELIINAKSPPPAVSKNNCKFCQYKDDICERI